MVQGLVGFNSVQYVHMVQGLAGLVNMVQWPGATVQCTICTCGTGPAGAVQNVCSINQVYSSSDEQHVDSEAATTFLIIFSHLVLSLDLQYSSINT